MSEIETILWKERVGNPFAKHLEPAMDSDTGYIKQTRVRRTGCASAGIYNVVYDRCFLSEYLHRMICKPLFTLGKDRTLKLIAEAWDAYYGPNSVVLPSKREV